MKIAFDLTMWEKGNDTCDLKMEITEFISEHHQQTKKEYESIKRLIHLISNKKELVNEFLKSKDQDKLYKGMTVTYTPMNVYRHLELNDFTNFVTNDAVEHDLVKQGQLVHSKLRK